MEERVNQHSGQDPLKQNQTQVEMEMEKEKEKSIPTFVPKPKPPPGTYVVQIPKDQVYRIPHPHADRRTSLHRLRRGTCRRCCCCTIFLIVLLLLAAAILAGVFYFAARPRALRFSIASVSARGFNLTSARPISPELVVGVRAYNPNAAVGVEYRPDSSVSASYAGVVLADGKLPVFYQGTKNVTTLTVDLTGAELLLADDVRSRMTAEIRRGNIPLAVDVTAPVRFRVWGVRSWTIEVRAKCDLGLSSLARNTDLISSQCRINVDPFP